MTDHVLTWRTRARRTALLGCVVCGLCACASKEDALRKQVAELRYEVAQGDQRNADLKRRMRLAEARNRVLISLVKGLTAEPGSTDAAAASVGRAEQSLAALDRDLGELAATLRDTRDDMQSLRSQRKSLEDELTRATSSIEQVKAEEQAASQRAAALREMLLRFQAMMVAGNLKVRVIDNRMVLQLPDALLFDRGRAALKKPGRVLLDQVARALIAVGDREFQVAGHTASGRADAGDYASDWALSAQRAVLVTQYLIAQGVPKERLSAAALADTRPANAERSQQADRENRRVEIVLVPRLDELPDSATLDALLADAKPPEDATTAAAPSADTAAAAPSSAPIASDPEQPASPVQSISTVPGL